MDDSLETRLRHGKASREDWQVYGDLLIEQGDPRGELVALGIALEDVADAEDAEATKLARRMDTLQRRIDPELCEIARRNPGFFDLDWSYGFVSQARAVAKIVVEGETTASPHREREWLQTLLDSPASKFLRALEIDRERRDDVSFGELGKQGLYEWAAPLFSASRERPQLQLPQLRSLRIGTEPTANMHLSETSNAMITSGLGGTPGARICRPDQWIGDVSDALAPLPNLEQLRLTGEGIAFSSLPSNLRSLTIETRFLRASTLAVVANATLPSLELLDLWLGNWPDSAPEFEGPEPEQFYGKSTSAADVARLLIGNGLPKVRRLALTNCAWMSELALAIGHTSKTSKGKDALVTRIEELDLSWGFMDGSQARPLLDNAPHLKHLKRLDLSHNQIDEAMQARLRQAFGDVVVLGNQEPLRGSAALRLLSF